VRDLVERNGVVTLLADWTDKNDTIKQALADLNSRSIPLLAIYPADPNAEVIVLPDLLTQGKVLEALKQAGPSRDVAQRSSSTKTASRQRVAAASERRASGPTHFAAAFDDAADAPAFEALLGELLGDALGVVLADHQG
jgi:Tfp pilus assembly major pilin PilA